MTEFLRGLTACRGGSKQCEGVVWVGWDEPLAEYQQSAEGYVGMQGGIDSSHSPPEYSILHLSYTSVYLLQHCSNF
jgi:hypothetical protein